MCRGTTTSTLSVGATNLRCRVRELVLPEVTKTYRGPPVSTTFLNFGTYSRGDLVVEVLGRLVSYYLVLRFFGPGSSLVHEPVPQNPFREISGRFICLRGDDIISLD